MKNSQFDKTQANSSDIKQMRQKLDQLNIPSKALNAKNYNLVCLIYKQISKLKTKSLQQIGIKLNNQKLSNLYKNNSQLQNQHIKLCKQLMYQKQKLSQLRSNFDIKKDNISVYRHYFNHQERICDALKQKIKKVSKLLNDVSYKLKGINSDNFLNNDAYSEDNLSKIPNQSYHKVLNYKCLPQLQVQQIQYYQDHYFQSFQKEVNQILRLKSNIHLYTEKNQNRQSQINRLRSRINFNTRHLQHLATQATISNLKNHKQSLQSQLHFLHKSINKSFKKV